MNAEKKTRRPPKPSANEATQFLVRTALPFLSLPYDKLSKDILFDESREEAVEKVLSAVADIVWKLGGKSFTPANTFGQLVRNGWKEPVVIQHLLCTLSGCRTMIRAVTAKNPGGSHVIFPPCYKETIPPWDRPIANADLTTWAVAALSSVMPWVVWGPGHSYIEWMAPGRHPKTLTNGKAAIDSWLPGLRAELVRRIGESFDSRGGGTPNGAYYLATCDYCGKVFTRERVTKTTCSAACKTAKLRRDMMVETAKKRQDSE